MNGSSNIQKQVYYKYVDDTVKRFRMLSILIFAGEICLMILDFKSGFFQDNPINHLNLLAELLLIVSSFIIHVICRLEKEDREKDARYKVAMIIAYRVVIMLAVILFAFTDVYVRHKTIGTYLVFLFVLQVTPAYEGRINWIQYLSVGAFTVVSYYIFASGSPNTMFGTVAIFLSFAISADYLRKFFIRQLENYYLAEESNSRYRRLARQTIHALSGAVEAKDLYTNGHSLRVAEYSRRIAERAGYDAQRCDEVYFIALMHDIGKIGVPDQVINKTSRLTDEEFAMIKRHPVVGYEILKQITELPGISEGARWHHERYDGGGYPDGLKAEDTPEIARLIAVADAYDAMTSNRSYRDTMPQNAVRKEVADNLGSQFDPRFGKIMLQLIDEDVDYLMCERGEYSQ